MPTSPRDRLQIDHRAVGRGHAVGYISEKRSCLPRGDTGTALAEPGAGARAAGGAVGDDVPAVRSEDPRRRSLTLKGYGFAPRRRVRVRIRGLRRNGAVGRDAKALVVGVDPAGLVDQVLEGLAEVQLPEHRSHHRVVEVRLEVVEAVRIEVASAGSPGSSAPTPAAHRCRARSRRRSADPSRRGRPVAEPALQHRELSRLTGERELDEASPASACSGRRTSGWARTSPAPEAVSCCELPGAVDDRPDRARRVAGELLRLRRSGSGRPPARRPG